jgi:hypothetical protein
LMKTERERLADLSVVSSEHLSDGSVTVRSTADRCGHCRT